MDQDREREVEWQVGRWPVDGQQKMGRRATVCTSAHVLVRRAVVEVQGDLLAFLVDLCDALLPPPPLLSLCAHVPECMRGRCNSNVCVSVSCDSTVTGTASVQSVAVVSVCARRVFCLRVFSVLSLSVSVVLVVGGVRAAASGVCTRKSVFHRVLSLPSLCVSVCVLLSPPSECCLILPARCCTHRHIYTCPLSLVLSRICFPHPTSCAGRLFSHRMPPPLSLRGLPCGTNACVRAVSLPLSGCMHSFRFSLTRLCSPTRWPHPLSSVSPPLTHARRKAATAAAHARSSLTLEKTLAPCCVSICVRVRRCV